MRLRDALRKIKRTDPPPPQDGMARAYRSKRGNVFAWDGARYLAAIGLSSHVIEWKRLGERQWKVAKV